MTFELKLKNGTVVFVNQLNLRELYLIQPRHVTPHASGRGAIEAPFVTTRDEMRNLLLHDDDLPLLGGGTWNAGVEYKKHTSFNKTTESAGKETELQKSRPKIEMGQRQPTWNQYQALRETSFDHDLHHGTLHAAESGLSKGQVKLKVDTNESITTLESSSMVHFTAQMEDPAGGERPDAAKKRHAHENANLSHQHLNLLFVPSSLQHPPSSKT